jgi:hypothetical protein
MDPAPEAQSCLRAALDLALIRVAELVPIAITGRPHEEELIAGLHGDTV